MSIHTSSNRRFLIPALVGVSVFAGGLVHADTVNEKRVLRKAGGLADGELTNVVFTTSGPSGTVTEESFDRQGKAKIPKKDGNTETPVKHGGPEDGLDTRSEGDVKKAKVKRNGKVIKYVAKGDAGSLSLDGDGPAYSGVARATSKIRGKKVATKAKLSGSRTLSDGVTVQSATATASAESKF